MSTRKLSVCFVCLGNICRSPTAEGVFAKLVTDAGLRGIVKVDSAGIGAWHRGERADKRARTIAGQRGYDLNSVSRQITEEDFRSFDMFVAMDKSNIAELEALMLVPLFKAKISLLRNYDPRSPEGAEVPDPYYGSAADFEHMFSLVESACRGLFEHVRDHYHLSFPS